MKIHNHFLYYFFLSIILILGVFLIWVLNPNRNLQMISVIAISVIYAVIGIVHHLINHDLVGKIVVEYILVALLGIAASFFIFKGGFGF
jgi:hypothetical protein